MAEEGTVGSLLSSGAIDLTAEDAAGWESAPASFCGWISCGTGPRSSSSSPLLLAARTQLKVRSLFYSTTCDKLPDGRQSFTFNLIPFEDEEFEAVEHVDKYAAETEEAGKERDDESDGVEYESSSLSP
jgi:hypothetical protein